MGVVTGVRVDIRGLRAENLLRETKALSYAMKRLHEGTKARVPVLDGDLRDTSRILSISDTFAGVLYDRIYSRKQEERDWQKHPHGGQARFVRETWDRDMTEALDILIDRMTSGL
jgi:hypothetical protein